MILYLIVGGVIGVLTTAAVWLVGHSVTLDATAYALVVASVYFLGALTSFIAHSRITFRVKVPASRFVRHLGVAGGSALATGVISSLLRPIVPGAVLGFTLDSGLIDATAFLAAALIVAAGSYFLAKIYVFSE
jgi:putative flippase GtrA